MSEEIKGWKLVPIEPTDAMLATVRTNKLHPSCPDKWDGNNMRIYQAMIAAAPNSSVSGMEPVSYNNQIEMKPLYSAEQLATLQAKLEQAEAGLVELVDALRLMVNMPSPSEDNCGREYLNECKRNEAHKIANEAIAKYGVKS